MNTVWPVLQLYVGKTNLLQTFPIRAFLLVVNQISVQQIRLQIFSITFDRFINMPATPGEPSDPGHARTCKRSWVLFTVVMIRSPSSFTKLEQYAVNAQGSSTCSITSLEITISNLLSISCKSSINRSFMISLSVSKILTHHNIA